MNVLFLGNVDNPVAKWLHEKGNHVVSTERPITIDMITFLKPDIIVSYGYRHIIPLDIVEARPHGIVNLHISFLPYNRGADPNFWSWVENTPKGATIHYIDEGVDTGDIIVQKRLFFYPEKETLRSSYHKLHDAMVHLFIANWKYIEDGSCGYAPQQKEGTFHLKKDMEAYKPYLSDGWDTPCSFLTRVGEDAAVNAGQAEAFFA
jgi:methionyl-tRNA formyltransferase